MVLSDRLINPDVIGKTLLLLPVAPVSKTEIPSEDMVSNQGPVSEAYVVAGGLQPASLVPVSNKLSFTDVRLQLMEGYNV